MSRVVGADLYLVARMEVVRRGLAGMAAHLPAIHLRAAVREFSLLTFDPARDPFAATVVMAPTDELGTATKPSSAVPTRTRVLGLVFRSDEDDFIRAFACGADAFVLLEELTTEILAATILQLAHGIAILPRAMLEVMRPEHTPSVSPPPPMLTGRETLVLGVLAKGMTNKHIARQLGVSVNAVKRHVSSLMQKLGADNRTKTVMLAQHLGLVEGERKPLATVMPLEHLRRRLPPGA
jgi:DNA-binding NarL/FixJ family response regulator